MLALEVVLADADPVATMVFDEVDAGVGGRAATEIGSRLAALARTHQVIVVTHLAQVAAFADRHYVVDASSSGRVGTSDVRVVAGPDREVELARMLGGTDGASARAHARDLIATATTPVGTDEIAAAPRRPGTAGGSQLTKSSDGPDQVGPVDRAWRPVKPCAGGPVKQRHEAAPTALSHGQLSRSVHEASVTSVTCVTRSHRSRTGLAAQ